jgi:hypothetical protein
MTTKNFFMAFAGLASAVSIAAGVHEGLSKKDWTYLQATAGPITAAGIAMLSPGKEG